MSNEKTLYGSERFAEEEAHNAMDAAFEKSQKGFTTRRCLSCGSVLIIEDSGSSAVVWCALENQVLLTSRGL
jgi:hypothetical protein